MELTSKDLSRLIELNKKCAELEFKRTVLNADVGTELKTIQANAAELETKAKSAAIELVFPNQRSLERLAGELAKFQPAEVRESIKAKNGGAYSLLQERGAIVKANHENRLEIAKLAIMLAKMPSVDRSVVSDILRSGAIAQAVVLDLVNEGDVKRIARFMRRCGILCVAAGKELTPSTEPDEKEVKVEFSNRVIWIGQLAKEKLDINLSSIKELSTKIQLSNAVRQIQTFNDDEEAQFATLQKQYLDLLKQQDELLKDFNDEEKLSVQLKA